MVKIPSERIPTIYAQLMEQIKVRIQAAQESMKMGVERKDSPFAYLHAEFCYLQIRRVVELIALAVVVAHNEEEEFRINGLVGNWNADRIFGELEKLSPLAFPKPFKVNNGAAVDDVVIQDRGYLTKQSMMKIYHECGKLLHVGSLKELTKARRHYDVGEISKWLNRFIRFLDAHVVTLPNMRAMLIVQMASGHGNSVICQMFALAPAEVQPR